MCEEKKENGEKVEEEVCANCEEYKAGWKRALADYTNLKNDVEKSKAKWAQMSELEILEEFIPIYDNFKKAFAHDGGEENKAWQNWKQGIAYIMKQFGDVLSAHRVEEIKTVGEKFDPSLHESVGEEEAEAEPGMILKEVAAGYKMGDHVIRAARVIIAK